MGSTLSVRVREIATLRTARLYCSDYEWDKHAQAAKNAGMISEEIEAIKAGADAPGMTGKKPARENVEV